MPFPALKPKLDRFSLPAPAARRVLALRYRGLIHVASIQGRKSLIYRRSGDGLCIEGGLQANDAAVDATIRPTGAYNIALHFQVIAAGKEKKNVALRLLMENSTKAFGREEKTFLPPSAVCGCSQLAKEVTCSVQFYNPCNSTPAFPLSVCTQRTQWIIGGARKKTSLLPRVVLVSPRSETFFFW